MLSATPSFATEKSIVNNIVQLLDSQEFERAYALAVEQQEDWEGDPDFDYVFGIASRNTGHLNQAIFAFERVLQSRPFSKNARLGLAISYFELGNWDAAHRELTVLSTQAGLDENLLSQVAQYVDAIDRQRKRRDNPFYASARLGVGHDTNPNNGVEDEFVTIPSLGVVNLFDESIETSSLYSDLLLQARYVKQTDQHSGWRFAGSAQYAGYEDDVALDRTFMSASAAYFTQIAETDVSASVFYRPLWLDGDSLLNYYGVALTASTPLNRDFEIGADVTLASEDYEQLRGFDKDQLLGQVWLMRVFSNVSHRLAITLGTETAQNNQSFLDRDILGLGYRWRHRVDQQWEYQISLDYLDSEFQDINPLFDAIREDSFFSTDVSVIYVLNSQWALQSRLSYMRNDSELDLYEYQRLKFWLGATYEF